MNGSPLSSAPSTPSDEQRHKKQGSVTLGGEDYFMSALRFQGDSKSVPTTPQGTMTKRNATFSPRIQFHDTWPSGEYDRRGEIATCNRLTPMLAQQIKEELNTFKMVCSPSWHTWKFTDLVIGNGSSRELQDLYTLLLMIQYDYDCWSYEKQKPHIHPRIAQAYLKSCPASNQFFKAFSRSHSEV